MVIFFMAVLFLTGCGDKYVDNDSDGYYSNEDCDDGNANIYPDAIEVCNGIDDNCNNKIDDADSDMATEDLSLFFLDNDLDGYGGEQSILMCAETEGVSSESGDCDDSNPDVHPSALELCDDFDSDCDGLEDIQDTDVDPSTVLTVFLDSDNDGFGNPAVSLSSCSPLEGYVLNSEDCNDSDPTISPSISWYIDSDSDGYGNPSIVQMACEQPSGFITDNSDCNDSDASVNPAAIENCDGIDTDCDPLTSEDGMVSMWTNGIYSDESDYFSTGILGAPYELDITEHTQINFCAGTYYTLLNVHNDLTMYGLEGATLSGGESFGIIDATEPVPNRNIEIYNLIFEDGTMTFSMMGDESIDNTLIFENSSIYNSLNFGAGGIHIYGVDATISNSSFEEGESWFGGTGIYAEYSNIEVLNSTFTNLEAAGATAILVENSVIDITDSYFTDNYTENVGVVWGVNSSILCAGTTNNDYGFHSNYGGSESGVYLDEDSDFIATDCDFGDPLSAEDNEGIDVGYGSENGSVYYAGDNSNFSCANESCGVSNEISIGSLSNYAQPNTCPLHPEIIGNTYTISGTPTIESFSFPLAGYFSCLDNIYIPAIFKEDPQTGEWEEVWVGAGTFNVSVPIEVSSGPVGVPFRDGDRIALTVRGSLRFIYGYETNASSQSYIDFGEWEDSIIGQYCVGSCSVAEVPLEDSILTNSTRVAMSVEVTNLD